VTAQKEYQRGNLSLKPRAKGPSAWEFRWRDASGTQHSKLLGTVEMLPTKRDAQCVADALRLEINSELPKAVPITVATLIDRYLTDVVEMGRLAYATRSSYKSYLNGWVKEKFGQHTLDQVRTMAVEQWLGVIELAPKSKLHLRNVLHVLFECAARWELIKENPITRVRQGDTRQAEPDVLTPDEFHALLAELNTEPYRMMVIMAGCLGLARSEFVGLKWADIDFASSTLSVQRGVVHCHVGKPKTTARRKSIPLAHNLLTIVSAFREQSAYPADTDWVFASPYKRGAEPYWPDSALTDFVKPAVKRAGITKQVGWHTFRHSYSTLLRANGADIKVQSELLRHSNIGTTLNLYTQAVSEQKRAAHGQVGGQLLAV
jgi:site-specific recombinase XerD